MTDLKPGDRVTSPLLDAVLVAIENARPSDCAVIDCSVCKARTDHCDDLLAIAERHAPIQYGSGGLAICRVCDPGQGEWWPCPDYRLVIDRLTAWGAL